jgi:hypothetical protein
MDLNAGTVAWLADLAQLDRATTRRYCETFAGYLRLGAQERGPRWEVIAALKLRIIHRLYQAGATTEAIHEQVTPARPATEPRPSWRFWER